jgi:protein toll
MAEGDDDENMEFDVFLCCSYSDHEHIGRPLVDQLEKSRYRTCYHLRDFTAGEMITDNIIQAITVSKRTVCVVNKNFLTRYVVF